MAVLAIIAVIGIAYLAFTQYANAQSDTVDDLGGYVDTSANDATVKIARAIAVAEGGYNSDGSNKNNGSRPSRNHNPGDMTADLTGGKSIGKDGPFVMFSNDEDGWECLYAQVNAWLNGSSRYHNGDSTIEDLAGLGTETAYTTTDQSAWASTVANVLGVSTDTSLNEVG